MSRSKQPDSSVLMSLCGDDGSFEDLKRHLIQRGYEAIVIADWAFEGLSADDISKLRRDLDSVWVVHTLERPPAEVSKEIDFASELIGAERVGLLIESSVPIEAERDGYNRIRFERNRADQTADQLVAELQRMGVASRSGVHRRLEAVQNSRFATGLAAPMVLLTLTIGAAILATMYLLANGFLASDSDESAGSAVEGESQSAVQQPTTDLTESEGAGDDVFAPVDAAPAIGGGVPADPSGPTLSPGLSNSDASTPGGSSRLPDTCLLDLRAGAVFEEVSRCSQGGLLVLQGPIGPWHNDVGQIIISEGAVGSLVYEDVPGNVMLSEGIHQLDLDRSVYGLESLQVTFTGEGQHIHFVQVASRGSAELTLTYRLDS